MLKWHTEIFIRTYIIYAFKNNIISLITFVYWLQVKSVHNLQFHSGVFSRLLMNDRLLDALEDIMDTKNISLHHTKAHLKPPENGAPYLMHQVISWWQLKWKTFITNIIMSSILHTFRFDWDCSSLKIHSVLTETVRVKIQSVGLVFFLDL